MFRIMLMPAVQCVLMYTLLTLLTCRKTVAFDDPTPTQLDSDKCNVTEIVKFYFFSNERSSSADCDGVTLYSDTNLFANDPYNLQHIEFKNSNLSIVPTGVFNRFTNLTALHMSNNSVKTIYPGAFTGLSALEKLHLDNNQITRVSRGILDSLSNLKVLYLQNNSISEIAEDAFLGLVSLKYLYINNNNLLYILPTTLDELKSITLIDFSYNYLYQFDVNPIPSLTHCNISFNRLNSINLSIFSNRLSELELENNHINTISPEENGTGQIYLSHNNLTDIFDFGNDVTYLDLSENKISFLNFSNLSHDKMLETLDLSVNGITNLTIKVPSVLSSLKYLSLNGNYINVIAPGYFINLDKLITLDLSQNQLTEIDYGTFSGMENLQYLNLSYNKLSEIYQGSLYQVPKLTHLFLQNNQLTILDPQSLKNDLYYLRHIQLEENDWTCKFLYKVIRDFSSLGVVVVPGLAKSMSNIDGIACKIAENNELAVRNSIQAFHVDKTDFRNTTNFPKNSMNEFFETKVYEQLESIIQNKINKSLKKFGKAFNVDGNNVVLKHVNADTVERNSNKVTESDNISEEVPMYKLEKSSMGSNSDIPSSVYFEIFRIQQTVGHNSNIIMFLVILCIILIALLIVISLYLYNKNKDAKAFNKDTVMNNNGKIII